MNAKNIAILLAGGTGRRFGADRPKQFLPLHGRTIMEHSIDAFQQCALIDDIVIVVHRDYIDEVYSMAETFPKVSHVIAGGSERYESSLHALEVCRNDADYLLFHDAVRPFVSQDLITRLIKAGSGTRCVAAALPTTDTIVRAAPDGQLVETLRRSELWNMQTPQCFPRGIIAGAYALGLQDAQFSPTDDCGVVMHYMPDVPIYLVQGDPANIKITYPADLK